MQANRYGREELINQLANLVFKTKYELKLLSYCVEYIDQIDTSHQFTTTNSKYLLLFEYNKYLFLEELTINTYVDESQLQKVVDSFIWAIYGSCKNTLRLEHEISGDVGVAFYSLYYNDVESIINFLIEKTEELRMLE